MTNLRLVRLLLWSVVVIVGCFGLTLATGWYQVERAPRTVSIDTSVPPFGGRFSLVNQHGVRVTEQTFRGKASAYFFGFTHCPDVCPTTLTEMSRRLQTLGADADRLNVVFVSVDPDRDTPDVLKSYLESFDPRIIALTGTSAEIAAAAKTFNISHSKVVTGDTYTVNHTASVILHNASGQFVSLIDFHEQEDSAIAKMRRALALDHGRAP